MATANARKVFNFAIEINGVDQFLIQDVKAPEPEIGEVNHGATNHDIKTAGGVSYSNAELQKIKPTSSNDRRFLDWLLEAQNPITGTGGVPESYKKTVIFKELSTDGVTTLNSEIWEGAWVKKVAKGNFKRGNQNENVIETVTIVVDKVIPV